MEKNIGLAKKERKKRTLKQVTKPLYELDTITTHDNVKFTYRKDTSDIKAIKEAFGGIDTKRSSSYERIRTLPVFRIEKEDVWLDCGAHIGSFSLRALRNGCKRVICIEPQNDNFELLNMNLYENNKDLSNNVQVKRVALVANEDTKEISLHCTSSTYRHTTLEIAPEKYYEIQTVEACTLTKLIKEIYKEFKINAIKLDIEGNEKNVLKSFDFKSANINKLVFEYSFDHHPVMEEFYDLIDYLKTHFEIVYFRNSIPSRNSIWDTKITRGANGQTIWAINNL